MFGEEVRRRGIAKSACGVDRSPGRGRECGKANGQRLQVLTTRCQVDWVLGQARCGRRQASSPECDASERRRPLRDRIDMVFQLFGKLVK